MAMQQSNIIIVCYRAKCGIFFAVEEQTHIYRKLYYHSIPDNLQEVLKPNSLETRQFTIMIMLAPGPSTCLVTDKLTLR